MNRRINATTPPSLLMRLRNHSDSQSWQEFIDVYSPLLYDFCRLRGLQASDAADITQEVLLRVAKAIRDFEYDLIKGRFRDWLAKIVLNEIRRCVSKKQVPTATTGEFDNDSGTLESMWHEKAQQHLFQTALSRTKLHFTEETWHLFQLSWLQQMSVDEVAKERGVGVEKIYVARSRILKRLRYEVALLADDII